jgi:subtilisin family serine protease
MPKNVKSKTQRNVISRPPGSGTGKSAESQPAPRIVHVELRVPHWRIPARSKSKSAFRFAAGNKSANTHLHQTLNKHGLRDAHESFRMRHPDQRRRRSQAEKDHLSRFIDLHFPADADNEAILRELRALPEVAQAMEARPMIPAAFPLDPLVGTSDQEVIDPVSGLKLQWYIFRCGVNRAWMRVSGIGVVIADVDAGFRLDHQDLVGNLELNHMFNAVDGSNDVTAGDVAHGTAVLGLAAAASNTLGIAGVAFSAKLWSIETDAARGPSLTGNPVANAIDWVLGENSGGRRVVINIESQTDAGGNCEQNLPVGAAIRLAISKGFVVCVAAGNGGHDAGLADDGTSIAQTGSILVGATSFDPLTNPRAVSGTQASNFGTRVVVSAPGDPNNDVTCSASSTTDFTNNFGGTSGAAAKVAGAIALMLEANPSLTHDQVRSILVQTGSAINTDKKIGVFLNADAAVSAAFQFRQ